MFKRHTPMFSGRGFTLVELLVVIAIIGVLASIVMVSLSTARAKGRDARRIADLKSIQLALETYYNDNLKYPTSLASLKPNYMPFVPEDPLGNPSPMGVRSTYFYAALNVNETANCVPPIGVVATRYHLAAVLEVGSNDGTGNFSQDADMVGAVTPKQSCGGDPDFNGRTTGACSGPQGAVGAAETCYDVVNQ